MSRIGKQPVSLPSGVSVTVSGTEVSVKGPKGQLSERLPESIAVAVEADSVVLQRPDDRKTSRALHGLARALIANMVKGVTDGFTYNLKAFYSHFPMTLAVNGNTFQVNNYFGERVPRTAHILENVNVKVSNKVEVTVSGIDKEAVGQTAANIERCTTVKKRDRRVFQDGIYLLNKE